MKTNRVLKFMGLGCAGFVFVVVAILVVVGSLVPEASIYLGRQVPAKYMATVRSLGLLEEGEQIRYFYTDALIDIEDGFYFVTDRNLVAYSNEWEEPETVIPFEEIDYLEVEYDDSFWTDSYVEVYVEGEFYVGFPLSSERGRDRMFVEAIEEHIVARLETPALAPVDDAYVPQPRVELNFPDDATGDMLMGMRADGFDFESSHQVEFFVDIPTEQAAQSVGVFYEANSEMAPLIEVERRPLRRGGYELIVTKDMRVTYEGIVHFGELLQSGAAAEGGRFAAWNAKR